MFESIEKLYDYVNAKIEKLGAGKLLKLAKDELKIKGFDFLLDLLKQKSLEIGGPEIVLAEDRQSLVISIAKDVPDMGALNIFGTRSADFKLHVTKPADEFIFVLEATLNSMTIASMAESDLVDKNMPGFEELPASPFSEIKLSASTGKKEMTIIVSHSGADWDIFDLSLFTVLDMGMEFSIREGGEDEDSLVSNLAFNGTFAVGQTDIGAVVNIPLGAKEDATWTLSCNSPIKLQKSFEDLSNLLFSNSIQNYIPKELLGLNNTDPEKGIFLKQLDMDFGTADLSVQKAKITVNATGKITFGGIDFTNADIVLDLTPADAETAMDLTATIDITLAAAAKKGKLLTDKLMVMSLEIPAINGDWKLNSKGELALPLDKLAIIPGSVPKEDFKLPDGLKDVTNQLTFKNILSVFNPSIPSWKQASIDINYKIKWELIPSVLTVNELNLKLDAKKTTKAGVTTTLTTGSFDGDLWAGGQGDAGFPLKINATKKGADWTYTATATKIKLKKIIEALLGTGDIAAIPDVDISKLELKIDQTKKTFTGNASVESSWTPFDDKTIELTGSFTAKITSDRATATVKNTASIEGVMGIKGVDFFKNSKLKLSYNLKEKTTKAEFEGISVVYKNNVFVFNLGNLSLGTIITKMAAWISPNTILVFDDPWSVLNDINLKDLNIFFNPKDKVIGFVYKPGNGINLGFVSINSISLTCKRIAGKNQLFMKLDGQLAGKEIEGWDLMKPGAAPKVPGGGDSKFDLEYLAMGQRVRFKKTDDIKGMDQALTKLKDAFKEPDSEGEVPIGANTAIVFNQNSNWLIGARFTIINTVELGIIFNDPQLYGLLVKLKGDKAKSFKGLEFEIIYKKVSDTVGVFEIELKLPDAMRNLEFGAISVTLPVIGLQVYTNGNFKIDIGFPWNGDFARSFTVQAFPFIGSGGLYFAWLSAETATSTPAITNGNFSPVIEFGIGMALGLGKTFEKGILSGGLSLKVQGILQGVIGFYNPNPDPKTGAVIKSDANYYAVQGTLEIVGRIYGNINFAIIKASLDITVHVLAKVMFISYQPIDIYLEAGISVRLTIEIDLGLFSINIHFSFDATVKEHFQVGDIEATPWTLATKQPAGLLRQKHGHLFRSNRRLANPAAMSWSPLTFKSQPEVNMFFMPSLTVAAKKDDKGVDQQTPKYMNMLYIEAENPDKNGGPDASFTTLAKTMLVWCVNSGRGGQAATYEDLLAGKVSLDELQSCYEYFTHVKDANIPVEAINEFLSAFNVAVNLFEDKENGETPYGSIFPMFPLLTLKSTLQGEEYSTPVDFETFTPVSAAYRDEIEAYFKKIAVNYRDPLEAAHNAKKMHDGYVAAVTDTTPSMASVMYQDYFVMMAKAGINEAIDLMKNYSYAYKNESLVKLKQDFGVDQEVILNANRSVTLAANLPLNIKGLYVNIQDETINQLTTHYQVPAARIIALNIATAGIVKDGVKVKSETGTKEFGSDVTLQQIVDYFVGKDSQTPIADVVSSTDITGLDLFKTGSELIIEPLSYVIKKGDTISSIAANYSQFDITGGVNIYTFGEFNKNTAGIVAAGVEFTSPQLQKYVTRGSDTILSLAQKLCGGDINIMINSASFNEAFLQPDAEVYIPQFKFLANDIAGAADTIDTVLSRFGIEPELFVAANDDVEGMWAEGTAIMLINVVDIKISELLAQLTDKGRFNNLSGMAARFLLHGLRLPGDEGIKNARLLSSTNWEMHADTHSLYDLTGQGLNLPVLRDGDEFAIMLKKNPGASFINFNTRVKNGKKLMRVNSGDQLVATLKPEDISRINQLAKAVLDPKVPVLQPLQPYVETSRKFNFSNFTQWHYNAATPIWAGQATGVTPTIWQMPPSLLQAVYDLEKSITPGIKLVIAKQDVPNTPVKTEPVANYSWTLSVPLSVRKVFVTASESDTMPYIYEIIGTDEVSMIFLERLIRFCNTPGAPANIMDKVYVLYPPNPADNRSGSLLSNDPALVTSFIVKTNFSTESNPDFFKAETQPVKIDSDPKQFAEMVWQASIVKTGGFYLYYAFNKEEELPANLFTNDNKADLKLVFTFGAGIQKELAYDFMNSVAIGEGINPANAVLCAVSEVRNVSGLKTLATDSIQSIANNYRITIEELGDILADATISNLVKESVALSGLTYEVRPGDTLTSIAGHFGGTTYPNFAQLIKDANPGLTDADYSQVWTLINIPQITITPGTLPAGSITMSQIAAYFYVSVTKLSHLFKDIKGLFQTGHSYALTDQLLDRNATIRPGTVGVELKRKKAKPKEGDFAQYLENTFNMLGIKLAGNKYFEESGESLPAGFNDLEKLKNKRLLRSVSANELWNYQRVLPVAPYSVNNPLKGSDLSAELIVANPYAGIGGWVQLNMNWQDVFGNRTVDPFSSPGRFGGSTDRPLNLLPIKIAYTDQLTAIDKWPGFSANYACHKENADALLSLVFKFDVSNYVVYYPVNPDAPVDPDKEDSETQGDKFKKDQDKLLKKIKADHELYKNIIYQVWQPDVTFEVHNTLNNQKWTLTTDQLTQLRQMLKGIYKYLGDLIAKEDAKGYQLYEYYKVVAGDVLDTPFKTAAKIAADLQVSVNDLISINQGLEHPFQVSDVSEIIKPQAMPAALMLSCKCAADNTEQIFELRVDITIARDASLVDEAFTDTIGVSSVGTVLKPVGTTLEYAKGHFDEHMDTEGKQLSLGNFAIAFEQAYSNCKIASGTSAGNLLSSDKEKQLWVVRWGGKQGIGFEIINQPVYFSPAPLANHLVNFTGDLAIDIRKFEQDSGLSKEIERRNYAGVSIDDWAKRFLDSIDNFLQPEYAIPTYILDQNFLSDKSLKIIQEAKQTVATAITSFSGRDKIGSRLTNILEQPDYEPRDINTASEKLRQSLLVKLGNAYKADTVVWFKTKVESQYVAKDNFIPPNIYGQPLVPGIAQAAQLYSMSTSKIPLNKGESDMAFIFSTQNKQDQKSLKLPLAYQVTHIEYDIKPVHILKDSKNADYNASTWLSFVLPPVETIVTTEKQELNIPVPLKVYPTPPSIIAQEGNPSLKPGDKITLKNLLMWDYDYVYEQIGSAQDSINTKIEFNIDETDTLLKAFPDKYILFAHLAQFIEIYPELEGLFNQKLVPITPLSDQEDMKQVRIAVKTFAYLAGLIAGSWKKWQQPNETEDAPKRPFELYEITEFNTKDLRISKKGANADDMLLLRIDGTAQGVPAVSIAGFETVPAKDIDPALGNGYVFKESDGKYLKYADKGLHPKRTLKFAGLNILNKQNAWASISKVRNKDLVSGNKTNIPFIYRTPDVRFVNMMVPYLDTINYPDYKPINIAEIEGDAAAQNPLADILQQLFKTLFSDSGFCTIKLELYYNYTLGADPESMVITLPVALLPPLEVADPKDNMPFINMLANTMKNWFNATNPVTTNANYLFDLSVYSNYNNGNLPLLRIRDLFLPIKYISDPGL